MHDPANWVVFILVSGVLFFFAYVVIKGRQERQKDKQEGPDR